MSIFSLTKEILFPPAELAEEDGLLAIGGDLSVDRLMLAYHSGIFPWFEGEFPLWFSPDPRFVLFPQEMQVSKSMKQLIRQEKFRFSMNEAFEKVITHCSEIRRAGQRGTWITEDMKSAYIRLHQMGFAHSAEAWLEDELVGGLYGVKLNRVFCGESMFSKQSNSSKFAFIKFSDWLVGNGIELIDCQVFTKHLASLGARMIPRKEYLRFLR